MSPPATSRDGSNATPWCSAGAALAAGLGAVGLAVPGLSAIGWVGVVAAIGSAAARMALRHRKKGNDGALQLGAAIMNSAVGWYVTGRDGKDAVANPAYRQLLDIDEAVEPPDPRVLLEGLLADSGGETIVDLPLRNGTTRRLAFWPETPASPAGGTQA